MTVLLSNVLIGIFSTTLRLSPLYLFAGLGEIVTEKSGVANMGIEGIMLMSLFTTYAVDLTTGNPWLAILAALGVAGLIGAIFALLAVQMRLDQIVVGLAVYLSGIGLSFVLFNTFAGTRTLPAFVNIPNVHIPYLSDIPVRWADPLPTEYSRILRSCTCGIGFLFPRQDLSGTQGEGRRREPKGGRQHGCQCSEGQIPCGSLRCST